MPRRRWELRLALAEREEISRGLAAGLSLRAIAAGLGRAPSTVSREVLANGGRRQLPGGCGRIAAAWRRAVRPKPTKLAAGRRCAAMVEDKLGAGVVAAADRGVAAGGSIPNEMEMQVSHETIYRSLFVQTRGGLRKELTTHLRTKRAIAPPGRRAACRTDAGPAAEHPATSPQRPAEADDRAVPGHWEGDLVFGRGMTPVATLVERSTRFLMLVALPDGHRAELVADALAAKITTCRRR